MTRYLIDIRLMGPVKQQISDLSNRLRDQFRLENYLVAPHITLVGPFSTDNEERLVADFTRICSGVRKIPNYELGGYGVFDNTRVVYVTVTPDETLKQFRYALSQALVPYCSLRDYDLVSAEEFQFHATLAMKLDWLTLRRVQWYVSRQEDVIFRYHPIRATLLRNSRIVCEYDFLQERMLTRAQALSRATKKRDLDILKAWSDGNGE
jgi:2'-5' RNA ligase